MRVKCLAQEHNVVTPVRTGGSEPPASCTIYTAFSLIVVSFTPLRYFYCKILQNCSQFSPLHATLEMQFKLVYFVSKNSEIKAQVHPLLLCFLFLFFAT